MVRIHAPLPSCFCGVCPARNQDESHQLERQVDEALRPSEPWRGLRPQWQRVHQDCTGYGAVEQHEGKRSAFVGWTSRYVQ
ncbi:MAG: hypothetical protein [Podoviridae sp. ctda_1]|nr:MAG: hypothetical protein [Podoviridae sp. ctda_1]